MPLETPLSELDAVNVMLRAIGEAPVSALDAGSVPEVEIAQGILSDTSHAIQEHGWQFNTERDYPLVPDEDGLITLAANIVRVDRDDDNDTGDYDLVQRGTQLYDRKNHTDVFTDTVRAEVVLLLPFDSLPPIARRYITIKAARLMQAKFVGSETLNAFTDQEEREAKMAFEEAEGENTDHTIFNNYSVYRALDRQGS